MRGRIEIQGFCGDAHDSSAGEQEKGERRERREREALFTCLRLCTAIRRASGGGGGGPTM
jgi:hypothetical protein